MHNPVPAGASSEFSLREGDQILFERLSTPRPAPKVTLKSNWHDVSTSTRKLVAGQTGKRDVRGNTTDDQTSFRKLVPDFVSAVETERKFEIDLRVERVPQDAVLKDEEQMKEVSKKLEMLRIGSCTNSIPNDLSKGYVIFSEESRRAFYEMGNLELIELRGVLLTIPSSWAAAVLSWVWRAVTSGLPGRNR